MKAKYKCPDSPKLRIAKTSWSFCPSLIPNSSEKQQRMGVNSFDKKMSCQEKWSIDVLSLSPDDTHDYETGDIY